MNQLILATALGAAPLLLAGAAAAQCLPDNPGNNAVVTCGADDPDGFDFPTLDGIRLGVDSGVTVSNAADTDKDAIAVDDALRLTNDGTISATGDGKGVNVDNDLTLENNGTITAQDEAINTGNRAIVVNSGTITSDDRAIDVKDDSRVTNTGTITAGGEGIEFDDGGVLENYGGTIDALDDAVNPADNVLIYNSGRIRNVQTAQDVIDMGEAQDAIDLDSGTIFNLIGGEISSTFGDAIDYDPSAVPNSDIRNYGIIRGGNHAVETDGADTSNQRIVNYAGGMIEGQGGTALNLRLGADSYTHHAGATIAGGADFGGGDDLLDLVGLIEGTLGGVGAVFDGGADIDTVRFRDFSFSDMTARIVGGGAFRLTFGDGTAPDPFTVTLLNWERFDFGGTFYSAEEIAAAAVPLPATALLMGAGLAGFAAIRRRRRAA